MGVPRRPYTETIAREMLRELGESTVKSVSRGYLASDGKVPTKKSLDRHPFLRKLLRS